MSPEQASLAGVPAGQGWRRVLTPGAARREPVKALEVGPQSTEAQGTRAAQRHGVAAGSGGPTGSARAVCDGRRRATDVVYAMSVYTARLVGIRSHWLRQGQHTQFTQRNRI